MLEFDLLKEFVEHHGEEAVCMAIMRYLITTEPDYLMRARMLGEYCGGRKICPGMRGFIAGWCAEYTAMRIARKNLATIGGEECRGEVDGHNDFALLYTSDGDRILRTGDGK